MLSIKKTKKNIPDLTEFTDEDGSKWVQTSADDLFTSNELNEILEKIEKDTDKDGIVLAKFEFQKVNKEYYETILDLQERLKKQNEILKRLLTDAKLTIDRKNTKLKELVNYIRKLHLLLAYYKTNPEEIDKLIPSPDAVVYEPAVSYQQGTVKTEETDEEDKAASIEYSDVEEILLDSQGNETGSLPG
ncbi:MAG: hypothetical protein JW864_08980 [Spirochaetes bacterium]|nr:hypothetical protein [Spirochaetota bacterium]